jgi:hypothetical protein
MNENSKEEKIPQLEVVDLRLGDHGDDDVIMKNAKQ